MQIELCDICGQPLITFTDNGHVFEPIYMKQKTAQKLIWWRKWEFMAICGECRAMLARKRKEQDNEKEGKEKA